MNPQKWLQFPDCVPCHACLRPVPSGGVQPRWVATPSPTDGLPSHTWLLKTSFPRDQVPQMVSTANQLSH